MLEKLSVVNLAVVERAEADFGPGLNVITGETGAGKSVFMGALALVLGARADVGVVRDGCAEARIEAIFDLSAGGEACKRAETLLAEQGLPPCEEGRILIRRTISTKGGSRVWINDSTATVQTLRTLGVTLVDVHGADDRRELLDESFRRTILDGRVPSQVKLDYLEAWKKYAAAVSEFDTLREANISGEELERLRYSVDELTSAELSLEDETELPARHAAAAHAAELITAANVITDALGGEGEVSASSALYVVGAQLREMMRHYSPAKEWMVRTEKISTDIQELSREIADIAGHMDADSETLQALDDRLSLVQRLKRKYRCGSVAELKALLSERERRLADFEHREVRLEALERTVEITRAAVLDAGITLTEMRRKVAEKLSKAITKELSTLGFPKVKFTIELEPHEPDASGCDQIVCRFAPNPGEPARELAEIASTGELARVMLALKTVIAESERTDVLVFDEVDANIGGETGRAVGTKLRQVAKHRQVIAITHLPQTAACGETHFAVTKAIVGGRTKSTVIRITGEARVNELVRMLGGCTDTARQHARELLKSM